MVTMIDVFAAFVILVPLLVQCNNNTTEPLNATLSNIPSQLEIIKTLREAGKAERLHHSDECDPTMNDKLFNKMVNIHRDLFTTKILEDLVTEIKNTCDWKRHMVCDPTRKRCICGANSLWVPLTPEERNDQYSGRCALITNSPCYDSPEVHRKDPENILGIDPPFAACINGTSCQNGACKCTKPGTKECSDVENIFSTRLNSIWEEAKKFKWAGFNDSCIYGSNLTIDTRIHTLRSIQVMMKQWRENGVSVANLCDFTQGLECQPEGNDRLAKVGTCVCKKRSFYFNGTCQGEEASFCEFKIWAEDSAIGHQRPCLPELSCTTVIHSGTRRSFYACCYVGVFGYRSFESPKETRLFCPLQAHTLTPSFALIILTVISHLYNIYENYSRLKFLIIKFPKF